MIQKTTSFFMNSPKKKKKNKVFRNFLFFAVTNFVQVEHFSFLNVNVKSKCTFKVRFSPPPKKKKREAYFFFFFKMASLLLHVEVEGKIFVLGQTFSPLSHSNTQHNPHPTYQHKIDPMALYQPLYLPQVSELTP